MIFGRQPQKLQPSVHCLSVRTLEDASWIGENLGSGNVVVFSYRDLWIKNPIEAKRLLQQVKAFVLRYDGKMATLGQNLMLIVPKSHKLDITPSGVR